MKRKRTADFMQIFTWEQEIDDAVSIQIQADLLALEKKVEQLYPKLHESQSTVSTRNRPNLPVLHQLATSYEIANRHSLHPNPYAPTALLDLITLLYQLEADIRFDRVQANYRFRQIIACRGGFVDPYFTFLNAPTEPITHIIVVKAARLSLHGQLRQKGEVYLETIPQPWNSAIRIAPLLVE